MYRSKGSQTFKNRTHSYFYHSNSNSLLSIKKRQTTFVMNRSYFYTFFSTKRSKLPIPLSDLSKPSHRFLTGRNIFLQSLIYLLDLHIAHRCLKSDILLLQNLLMIEHFSRTIENSLSCPHDPKMSSYTRYDLYMHKLMDPMDYSFVHL